MLLRPILFLLFSIISLPLLPAQARYDNNWTLGYGKKATDSNGISGGGMIMSFDSLSPTILYTGFKSDRPAACISDRYGRFLAYTQGCSVWNRNLDKMLNGDSLNPGRTSFFYCPGIYPLYQSSLFLPMPGSDSLFYLMHIRSDDKQYLPMNLLYTVIDASGDGGNGAVISKNNVVLSDSLSLDGYVSATRHANGQDWWIVVPQLHKNGYHVSLLTAQGLEYKGIRKCGNSIATTDAANCCTQTAFSADGTKFFKNSRHGLVMSDFNRCDGTLSNAKFLPFDAAYSGWGGVVTSPNSRYLYLLAGNYVSQFDLQAPDVFATRQTVATYDGGVAPFPARFYQAQRGPDGKIYAVSTNSNNILHVIHSPDEPGLACNVEQRGLVLPALTGYILVNFVNYRLGPTSTPCDSTISALPSVPAVEPAGLDVYPNPASDEASFEQLGHWAGQGGRLRVSDLAGRLLWERAFQPSEPVLRWQVAGVPPGVYVWVYVRADGRRAAGRVAVQR